MLASTVQFSRYGRAHLLLTPSPTDARKRQSRWFNQIQWFVRPIPLHRSEIRPKGGLHPSPQDPTACLAPFLSLSTLSSPRAYLRSEVRRGRHVDVPPMSSRRPTNGARNEIGRPR